MKKLFLLIASIAIFSACKKTNDQPSPQIPTEKVCLLDSVTTDEGENAYLKYKNNVLIATETTEKDNSYFYYSANTFIDSNYWNGEIRFVKTYYLNNKSRATKFIKHQLEGNRLDTTYYFYNSDDNLIKDSTNELSMRFDGSQTIISISVSTTLYIYGRMETC